MLAYPRPPFQNRKNERESTQSRGPQPWLQMGIIWGAYKNYRSPGLTPLTQSGCSPDIGVFRSFPVSKSTFSFLGGKKKRTAAQRKSWRGGRENVPHSISVSSVSGTCHVPHLFPGLWSPPRPPYQTYYSSVFTKEETMVHVEEVWLSMDSVTPTPVLTPCCSHSTAEIFPVF